MDVGQINTNFQLGDPQDSPRKIETFFKSIWQTFFLEIDKFEKNIKTYCICLLRHLTFLLDILLDLQVSMDVFLS